MYKADFFRNDTWVCLDFKYQNPPGGIFSSHRRAHRTALSQRTAGAGGGCGGEGKITFFALTWIRFIGSRHNLAWVYYLTLGTSLRKNFSFFSKSKMVAGGQKFATRYTGRTKKNDTQVKAKNFFVICFLPLPFTDIILQHVTFLYL